MSCNTSKSVPLVAATWGEIEHTTRVFAGLHASLADPTLPMPAAVRASLPALTWAHVIDVLRITQSSKWREGIGFCKSAVGHHALWLLLGSDTPLPLEASRSLTAALTAALTKPFEDEALTEVRRAKKRLGEGPTCCLHAARVTVAHSMRWSAPADLVLLRYLMIDAKDATRKLRDSTAAAAASRPAAPPSLPAQPSFSIAAAAPRPAASAAAAVAKGDDPEDPEALAALVAHVAACGGGALDGWRATRAARGDKYYFEPGGRRFRSRAEVRAASATMRGPRPRPLPRPLPRSHPTPDLTPNRHPHLPSS